ncbi:MAG TPA: nitrile hydratase subunit beta [Gammaproteobacteria bacterium]|nr:nitrile hydratase subunit beta [Gammaproteobacteria bacterium]
MNGIHDLGGMDGFPLPARDQGFALKEEWERLVWGMLFASASIPGMPSGASRSYIERIRPERYLTMPYYARFLEARMQNLLESGLVTQQEVDNPDGPVSMPDLPGYVAPTPEQIVRFLREDRSARLDVDAPASFAVGDAVVVKNDHPAGHTRVPRYVRGRRGVVLRDHGVHAFEDDVAPGTQVGPQHLYTVEFTGPELWGRRGHPRDRIHVELWDVHLARGA